MGTKVLGGIGVLARGTLLAGVFYAGCSSALARTKGQAFTVQVTVLPSGQVAAPRSSSAPIGASTPLTRTQREQLLRSTSAPVVTVTYE